MLNPIRLCNDLFDDSKLYDNDLRAFSEDHLVRLSNPDNNPGGVYNNLIADTTTRYTNYYGKMSNEASKKAIAEGTTITRNNAREAAEGKISQLQGLVKYKFGETGAVYQALYPLGMTEYYQAREGDIGTLFDRFVTNATTYLNAEYPTDVNEINGLVTLFHSAYNARELIVSQIDTIASGLQADRKLLTKQLTTNLLTIAINNIDEPNRFNDYYNPFYLPLSETNNSAQYEGAILGDQVINMDTEDLDIENGTTFNLFNPSHTVLRYYFAENPGDVFNHSTPFVDVEPNQSIIKTAAQLGLAPTRQYFNVQNLGNNDGNYKVIVSQE